MSELPEGWVQVPLGELCDLNPKHSKDLDRSTLVSFVPMPAVSDELGIVMEHEHRKLEEVWKGYTHFQEGDVIFAKITPCMENGKIAVARGLRNGIACGSTEFFVFRCPEGFSNQLLWYFFSAEEFSGRIRTTYGGSCRSKARPTFVYGRVNFQSSARARAAPNCIKAGQAVYADEGRTR